MSNRIHQILVEFNIMESMGSGSRTIQSVQRAFDLLELVAASPEGARLSELADGAGLNRSTSHNLLASLEALGYITQHGKGNPYRLTSKLRRLLGPSVGTEHALRARVRPLLAQITAETGETSYLAFAAGEEYLCADAEQSASPLHLTVSPGEREPLLGTAIGHALLADSHELAEDLLARHTLEMDAHIDQIRAVARQGFALDLDSYHPGVSCVAVPYGNGAAIGVAGPTSRLPRHQLIEIGERVRGLVLASLSG